MEDEDGLIEDECCSDKVHEDVWMSKMSDWVIEDVDGDSWKMIYVVYAS